MTTEKLTQDEIDALVNGSLAEFDTVITGKLSISVTPQLAAELNTMNDRYYYALTHCGIEEQRAARENLHHAAFNMWLCRHGFANRTAYMNFVNREAEKRGLNWRLRGR